MAEGWENSADAYARSFARLCAGTVDEILTRLDPPDGHRFVLDVGTGPGTVAAAVHGSGRAVVGMDQDRSMTALAARRHRGVPFAAAALPRLPLADQAVGAITANFVVNHTPDPRAALQELCRVVRRGGQLVATIWTSQVVPLSQLWSEVMLQASVSPPPGARLPPELDFERTVDGFAEILAEAGFDGVDCQETQWIFKIAPDELWVAVEAGIAVVGQTYRSQSSSGRMRMRTAFMEITSMHSVNGRLILPSIALIASGRRT